MDTNEQTNSVNNSSALGNISVLTPSQRREQERLRKEQEENEAAKTREASCCSATTQRKKQTRKQNRHFYCGNWNYRFCAHSIRYFLE